MPNTCEEDSEASRPRIRMRGFTLYWIMEREHIRKLVGKLVRVDLHFGHNLEGTLRASAVSTGMFEVVSPDGTQQALFWPWDAEDVSELQHA
jgi:hypothetical protein